MYLEPTYIRDNVDYSFGDQSGRGILGGYMKDANMGNTEFLNKVKEIEGINKYMTLFIDNIRLYERVGIKDTAMEEYVPSAKSYKNNVLTDLWSRNDLLKLCGSLPHIKFVIFTGFEDNCIDEFIWGKIPENVIGIYASNSITFGGKVHPIPYGVQRKLSHSDDRHEVLSDVVNNHESEPTKLLYINHSEGTNPKERGGLNDLFVNEWSTINKINNTHAGYRGYLHTIKNHKFMICPSGNAIGCECSRDWEVIYMRRVPVVKRSPYLEHIFKNIPVLFVDEFNDVTEELLINNDHLFEEMKNFDFTILDFKNIFDNTLKKIDNDIN
jgi:uncharacterized protein YihD (DUF1040 family)